MMLCLVYVVEVNRAALDLCLQTIRHEDERTQSHCVAFAALITSLHALVDQQIGACLRASIQVDCVVCAGLCVFVCARVCV